MKIKGHTQIILKDAKTGEVTQKVEDDNMVTNALQYVIDICARMNYSMDHVMPIATNALGGIFLFDNTLKEDPENIYFPGGNCHLVGYGDRGSNNADTMRGTLNASESGYIQGGYKSVWDFGTSQANGTIKSVALTSAQSGGMPLQNFTNHDSSWLSNGFSDQNLDWVPVLYVEPYVYMAKIMNRTQLKVAKLKVPVHLIGVNEHAHQNDGWYKADEIATLDIEPFISTYWFRTQFNGENNDGKSNTRGDTTSIYPRYVKDGHDGYLYGVCHTGNRMYLLTCKYSDESFALSKVKENVYDVSVSFRGNVSISEWSCSEYYSTTEPNTRNMYSDNFFTDETWCIANGYLYILKSNRKSIYRISLSNTAEIVEFPIYQNADRDYVDHLYASADRNGMVHIACIHYNEAGNTSWRASVLYEDGTVIIPSITTNINFNYYAGSPNTDHQFDYGMGRGDKLERFQTGWYNRNGNERDAIALFYDTNYLGTINNLPSAITKNASQTMKIIYTLTDVEDDTQ